MRALAAAFLRLRLHKTAPHYFTDDGGGLLYQLRTILSIADYCNDYDGLFPQLRTDSSLADYANDCGLR